MAKEKKEKKAKPEFDAKSAKPVVKDDQVWFDVNFEGEESRRRSAEAWARQASPNSYWPYML